MVRNCLALVFVPFVLAMSIPAYATSNNTPPSTVVTPCGTGHLTSDPAVCGTWSARAYPSKACGTYSPNNVYLCQPYEEPPTPYIDCWHYGNVGSCYAYPSEANELSFSWHSNTGLTIFSYGANNAAIDYSCSGPWSGDLTVMVYNSVTGQTSALSVIAICGEADSF